MMYHECLIKILSSALYLNALKQTKLHYCNITEDILFDNLTEIINNLKTIGNKSKSFYKLFEANCIDVLLYSKIGENNLKTKICKQYFSTEELTNECLTSLNKLKKYTIENIISNCLELHNNTLLSPIIHPDFFLDITVEFPLQLERIIELHLLQNYILANEIEIILNAILTKHCYQSLYYFIFNIELTGSDIIFREHNLMHYLSYIGDISLIKTFINNNDSEDGFFSNNVSSNYKKFLYILFNNENLYRLTPLMIAVKTHNLDLLKYLANIVHINLNQQNSNGEMALTLAVNDNYIEAIQTLLTYGGSPLSNYENILSPLDIALSLANTNPEIILTFITNSTMQELTYYDESFAHKIISLFFSSPSWRSFLKDFYNDILPESLFVDNDAINVINRLSLLAMFDKCYSSLSINPLLFFLSAIPSGQEIMLALSKSYNFRENLRTHLLDKFYLIQTGVEKGLSPLYMLYNQNKGYKILSILSEDTNSHEWLVKINNTYFNKDLSNIKSNNIFKNLFPKPSHASPIKISYGQGILYYYLYCLEQNNLNISNFLAETYLKGINDINILQRINDFLSNSHLKKFSISNHYKAINNDFSRCYFETLLSITALQHKLPNLSTDLLEEYANNLYGFFFKKQGDISELILKFYGAKTHPLQNLLHTYDENTPENKKTLFHTSFNAEERHKIILLFIINYLATKNINQPLADSIFQIDIYNIDNPYYNETNRGREEVFNQPLNSHPGILKSWFPIPRDDILDPYCQIPVIKNTNNFIPIKDSYYPAINNANNIHPFISSISGYMLAQLRCFLLYIKSNEEETTAIKPHMYFDLFASLACAQLLLSGGHSLFEFFATFQIKEVIAAYCEINIDIGALTMEHAFLNTPYFNDVILKTAMYNQSILQKKELNYAIYKQKNNFFNSKMFHGKRKDYTIEEKIEEGDDETTHDELSYTTI